MKKIDKNNHSEDSSIEYPDLYLCQDILRAFVDKTLNNIHLVEYVRNQIASDEFIAEMVEGIKLEKSIKYEKNRKTLLKENKVQLKEIKALNKPSILRKLRKALSTVGNLIKSFSTNINFTIINIIPPPKAPINL